ncbi:uncharacterized [Tachysurus ichikawai]
MQDTSWIFLIKKTRPRLRLVPPQAGWRDVSVSVPSAGSDESAVAVQRFLPDINHTGAERDSERVDTILALLSCRLSDSPIELIDPSTQS